MALPQDEINYTGDSLSLNYVLYESKRLNTRWDLTNHAIRFQLGSSSPIKKATSNVSGGSDSQIQITDATNGEFSIFITKIESRALAVGDYDFEIEVTGPAPSYTRTTVKRGIMRVKSDLITWESI